MKTALIYGATSKSGKRRFLTLWALSTGWKYARVTFLFKPEPPEKLGSVLRRLFLLVANLWKQNACVSLPDLLAIDGASHRTYVVLQS